MLYFPRANKWAARLLWAFAAFWVFVILSTTIGPKITGSLQAIPPAEVREIAKKIRANSITKNMNDAVVLDEVNKLAKVLNADPSCFSQTSTWDFFGDMYWGKGNDADKTSLAVLMAMKRGNIKQTCY